MIFLIVWVIFGWYEIDRFNIWEIGVERFENKIILVFYG